MSSSPSNPSNAIMRGIQAVIFDLDGLIVDSEPLQLRAINEALAPVGIRLSATEWKQRVGRKSLETLHWLQATHHFEQDPTELERAKVRAYQRLIREAGTLNLMPGVHDIMRACQQAQPKLALASSSVRADIDIILQTFDLGTLFEVVVSGDEVAHGKPDPEIFVLAASRLAVDPSACLVIEDAPAGIAAANAAGMISAAIPNRFTQHQDFDGAHYRFESLSLLADELDTIIFKEI